MQVKVYIQFIVTLGISLIYLLDFTDQKFGIP